MFIDEIDGFFRRRLRGGYDMNWILCEISGNEVFFKYLVFVLFFQYKFFSFDIFYVQIYIERLDVSIWGKYFIIYRLCFYVFFGQRIFF